MGSFGGGFSSGAGDVDARGGASGAHITGTLEIASTETVGTIIDLDPDNTRISLYDDQDTGDKVVMTMAQHGAFSIVSTDDDAAAANIQITADGTAELAGTTVTLDSSGDIALSADGGNVTMDDGTSTIFDFNVDDTTLTIHDDQDTGDKFVITVAQHGAATIATTDDDSNDDADLTLDADGKIVVEAKAGDEVVFNEGSADVDFRVESDNMTHAIFVDGATGHVSIGDSAQGAQSVRCLTLGDGNTANNSIIGFDVSSTEKWAVGRTQDGSGNGGFTFYNSAQSEHAMFIDEDNSRVGIGTPAAAGIKNPGATLEIGNSTTEGAPLLLLDSNDTDQIALDIDADNIDANVVDIAADAVTTAKVFHITADGLTTGRAVYVDDNSSDTGTRNTVEILQNNPSAIAATALGVQSDGGVRGMYLTKGFSSTTAATVDGFIIDYDKTGASTSNNILRGMFIDMDNTTATNGTNTMTGLSVTPTLTHAADAGTPTVKGVIVTATGGTNGTSVATAMELTSTGADTNNGLIVNCADGGSDLKLLSSADTADYCTLAVGASGATTLTTVDGGAAAANLTFTVDGDIILGPAGGSLVVKSKPITDNTPVILTLQTGETDIAADEVLGQIDFQAPDEGAGTDAILVAAGIAAISEGDFAADNNATSLVFKTGASEAAAEKVRITSDGQLQIKDPDSADHIQLDHDGTYANVRSNSGAIVMRPDNNMVWFLDDVNIAMGNGNDSNFLWETADPNANCALLTLPTGTGTNASVLVIGNKANPTILNANLGLFDGITDPTLALVSTSNAGYISLSHDGTDATMKTNTGDIVLNPAGGDVLPDGDNTRNLGSASKRWANIHTGDLHLTNDRGDWTVIEEEEYLSLRNNKTGKRFKIMMQEIDEDDE